MNVSIKSILVGALICLTACVSAAKHTPAQTALVLDEKTQQPIEGAIVVARWIGTITQLVDSQTTCYHVESATTDAQGQYSLPGWTKLPGKVHHNAITYTAYKAGYRQVRTDKATGNQYLRRDTGTVKDRLEYLDRATVFCADAGDSMRKLLPLYKSMYSEASLLTTSKKEKIEALYHLKRIEVIELGSDEAWSRFHERERSLK